MTRPGPHCIATISGRVVDLAAPTPDMIDIEDIAHALSLLCRYNGHVEYHYSVAQHSCLVADHLHVNPPKRRHTPDEWAFSGLMHDAAEAYVGDMGSPLKKMLPEFSMAEDAVFWAIADAFDYTPLDVHNADIYLYAWERRDVAHVPGIWDVPADLVLPEQIITPWPAAQAKAEFLERFGRYRADEDARRTALHVTYALDNLCDGCDQALGYGAQIRIPIADGIYRKYHYAKRHTKCRAAANAKAAEVGGTINVSFGWAQFVPAPSSEVTT